MALAKRGSRTIAVGGTAYRWTVSPDSGYMWVVVEHAGSPGRRVEAMFEYGDRVVTPEVVRRVIERALGCGWRPTEKGVKALRVVDAGRPARAGCP